MQNFLGNFFGTFLEHSWNLLGTFFVDFLDNFTQWSTEFSAHQTYITTQQLHKSKSNFYREGLLTKQSESVFFNCLKLLFNHYPVSSGSMNVAAVRAAADKVARYVRPTRADPTRGTISIEDRSGYSARTGVAEVTITRPGASFRRGVWRRTDINAASQAMSSELAGSSVLPLFRAFQAKAALILHDDYHRPLVEYPEGIIMFTLHGKFSFVTPDDMDAGANMDNMTNVLSFYNLGKYDERALGRITIAKLRAHIESELQRETSSETVLVVHEWNSTRIRFLFVESAANRAAGCNDTAAVQKKARVATLTLDGKDVGLINPANSGGNNCGLACLKYFTKNKSHANSLRKVLELPLGTMLAPQQLDRVALHFKIRIIVYQFAENSFAFEELYRSPIDGDMPVHKLLLVTKPIPTIKWTQHVTIANPHYLALELVEPKVKKPRGKKRKTCVACGSQADEHSCPVAAQAFKYASKRLKTLQQVNAQHSDIEDVMTKIRTAMTDSRHIIIQGGAGTGKTFIIQTLQESDLAPQILFTSTTGCSAQLFGGETLHFMSDLFRGANIKPEKLIRMLAAKYILIDEASMLGGGTLDEMMSHLRQHKLEHLRLLLIGDFLQLPPVGERPESDGTFTLSLYGAKSFLHMQVEHGFEYITVAKNHRFTHQADAELIDRVRFNACNTVDFDRLTELVIATSNELRDRPDAIDRTFIFVSNKCVREHNEWMLAKLPGGNPTVEYKAEDDAKLFNWKSQLLDVLTLKVGARVICIVNLDRDFKNGTEGIVTALSNNAITVKSVRNNKVKVFVRSSEGPNRNSEGVIISPCRKQFPLLLAYARTINRYQGATIDGLGCISLRDIRHPGQFYVALSRFRRLDDILIAKDDLVNKHHTIRRAIVVDNFAIAFTEYVADPNRKQTFLLPAAKIELGVMPRISTAEDGMVTITKPRKTKNNYINERRIVYDMETFNDATRTAVPYSVQYLHVDGKRQERHLIMDERFTERNHDIQAALEERYPPNKLPEVEYDKDPCMLFVKHLERIFQNDVKSFELAKKRKQRAKTMIFRHHPVQILAYSGGSFDMAFFLDRMTRRPHFLEEFKVTFMNRRNSQTIIRGSIYHIKTGLRVAVTHDLFLLMSPNGLGKVAKDYGTPLQKGHLPFAFINLLGMDKFANRIGEFAVPISAFPKESFPPNSAKHVHLSVDKQAYENLMTNVNDNAAYNELLDDLPPGDFKCIRMNLLREFVDYSMNDVDVLEDVYIKADEVVRSYLDGASILDFPTASSVGSYVLDRGACTYIDKHKLNGKDKCVTKNLYITTNHRLTALMESFIRNGVFGGKFSNRVGAFISRQLDQLLGLKPGTIASMSASIQSLQIEALVDAWNKKPEEERRRLYELVVDYYTYLDVNSLYPYAMRTMKVGHGKPTNISAETAAAFTADQSLIPETAMLEVEIVGNLIDLEPWTPYKIDTRPPTAVGKPSKQHLRTRWSNERRIQVMTGVDLHTMLADGSGRLYRVHAGVVFEKEDPIYSDVILKLYNDRKIAKKEGKGCLDAFLKLVMNAGYGVTLMETSGNIESALCSNILEIGAFVRTHTDWSVLPTDGEGFLFSGNRIVEKNKDMQLSKSIPQVGALVLAVSRRRMAEVYSIAHPDHASGTFESVLNQSLYTDTDSMFVHADGFKRLHEAGLMGLDLGMLKDEFSEHTFMEGRPGKILTYSSPTGKNNAVLYLDGESYTIKKHFRCKFMPQFTPVSIMHPDDDEKVIAEHSKVGWAAMNDLFWYYRKFETSVRVDLRDRMRKQMKADVAGNGKKTPFKVYTIDTHKNVMQHMAPSREVLGWQDPEQRLFDVSVPFGWTGQRVPSDVMDESKD